MLVAAFTQAAAGESVAAGTEEAVVRTSEEETYWIAPLPTPTVTMLSSAGSGTAEVLAEEHRAGGAAGELLVVDQGEALHLGGGEPEHRRRARPATTCAAVAASLEVAAPRVPETGEMEAGVPKAFQRTAAERPATADFCADVGAATAAHVEVAEPGGDLLEGLRSQPGRGDGRRPGQLAETGHQGGRGGDAEEPDGRAGHGASAGLASTGGVEGAMLQH